MGTVLPPRDLPVVGAEVPRERQEPLAVPALRRERRAERADAVAEELGRARRPGRRLRSGRRPR
jgi:hypothetical protein